MVNYKDLGLVNTRDMFAKAIKGGYAIPAFILVDDKGNDFFKQLKPWIPCKECQK